MYFGGGRSDKLFSCWTNKMEDAKMFSSKEDITPIINGLLERNTTYGVDTIRELMAGIPPYEDGAYVVLEVVVHRPEEVVNHVRASQ